MIYSRFQDFFFSPPKIAAGLKDVIPHGASGNWDLHDHCFQCAFMPVDVTGSYTPGLLKTAVSCFHLRSHISETTHKTIQCRNRLEKEHRVQ